MRTKKVFKVFNNNQRPIKEFNRVDELAKILEAAYSLFKRYGIRSVTMSDIAKTLGISKKTLYVHIENKRDLIDKIMTAAIQEERANCLNIQEVSSNALEELLKMSLYVQKDIININPSLIFDLQKYHYPVWERMNHFHMEEMVNMIEDNLARGVKEGVYRSDVELGLISRLFVGLGNLITNLELFPPDQFSTQTIYKKLIKYHIHGIVSEQGRQLLPELLASVDPEGIIY